MTRTMVTKGLWLALLAFLPVLLFLLAPTRGLVSDGAEYVMLSQTPEIRDTQVVGELVAGTLVTQAVTVDGLAYERALSAGSGSQVCVELLLANYSDRRNSGQVEVGLSRRGTLLGAARLDVGGVADNAYQRICLDDVDLGDLRGGGVELFLAGVDSPPAAAITAWLVADPRTGPAWVNGTQTPKGLAYRLTARKQMPGGTAALWVFVLLYAAFIGLLGWRLLFSRGAAPAVGAPGGFVEPIPLPPAASEAGGRVLFIQIPCYNEAATLATTLADLPRTLPGFARVEWLVVDDGSTDGTADVAGAHGVDHVIRHTRNQGLARTFMTGLQACVRLGADVIVNTDADNQYRAADIPALVAPILAGRADIVVGERPIEVIEHFSPLKKFLQKLGSWVVRVASRTDIPDAPSGFRAMTREAAQRLVVFNDYTYTLETIIQAGQKNMAITSVQIRVNPDLRPSRLVRSIPSYVGRSLMTIVRIFVIYRPFRSFALVGAVLFGFGLLLGLRFLYLYVGGQGEGHVQSLILASILLGMGFQTWLVAFLADLLAANRKLLEDIRYGQQRALDSARPDRRGEGHDG